MSSITMRFDFNTDPDFESAALQFCVNSKMCIIISKRAICWRQTNYNNNHTLAPFKAATLHSSIYLYSHGYCLHLSHFWFFKASALNALPTNYNIGALENDIVGKCWLRNPMTRYRWIYIKSKQSESKAKVIFEAQKKQRLM